ncbi:helix-turn-helix domain-containing protein [Paraflavitalea sp. CAU 1676]|uniref:helix-turn-helix domain-containing protein n=1 Tax=Paraflavitalea sp. CAU 1676 TaxID=3032598 RepID=UPI0023DC1659|nr:helix-turn-helix domain-containing protein [Paraflavitalea sp. CAU 1676]MDF2192684.1 helix-turn-helix domain-containing protein [Paraflavitalea sp. CAU 1676]
MAIIHAIIPMVIIMPVGPLLFFYIQSSLDANFTLTPKQRIHFLPVIIDLIPSFVVIVYFMGVACGIFSHDPKPWNAFIDNYNVYSDIPRWMSITCYLALSASYLAGLKNKEVAQSVNYKQMQAVTRIFLVFQIIWLAYLIPYIIPAYTDLMLGIFSWYPVYILMAFIMYWLGIKGYISHLHSLASSKKAGTVASLSPGIIQEAALLLQRSMEEDKMYLHPDLNLHEMAQHTGLPQKTISAVLNQHIGKSFTEFVNQYRVELLKEKLQQPAMSNFTIAAIAMECGFNSKATFQRIFKEFTGSSPSEYRKSLTDKEK